jgi:hypothetical protein
LRAGFVACRRAETERFDKESMKAGKREKAMVYLEPLILTKCEGLRLKLAEPTRIGFG